MDKLLLFVVLISLLGCKPRKEIIVEKEYIRDTLTITDTVVLTRVDSVVVIKDRVIDRKTSERADSVIIRIIRDTVLIRKYGLNTEEIQRDSTAVRLEKVLKEIMEQKTVIEQGSESNKERSISKERFGIQFWKYIAFGEAGAVIVLLLLLLVPKLIIKKIV